MLLRIFLLIGNAILLMFFAYVVIDSSIIHPHKEAILDYVLVYGIFTIYAPISSILFDVRESELGEHTGPSAAPSECGQARIRGGSSVAR